MNKLFGLAIAAAVSMTSTFAYADRANMLSDERVRQAIAYAIDMDTIVETLFEGKAIVADSMIPNGSFKAEGLEPYAYDPDKARALLDDAGWDGSQKLDVVYYYGDQLTADLMVALQAYLADVGVEMTYRKLEGDVGGQLNALPEEGSDTSAVTWDIAYGAKAALALQEYYNGYKSGQSSYAPGTPERDELIARINASADPAVQQEAFKDFERYENTMLSDIALYYQQLFIYESNRMSRNGGEYGNDQFTYDWNIVNWTVEPDDDGKEVLYTNTAPSTFFDHPWLNPGIYVFSKIGLDHLLTADGNLTPKGGQLASDYSVSDDGLTVTFTMKDGLTWHDGDDLTAEDVVWSIETAKTVPGINAVFMSTVRGDREHRGRGQHDHSDHVSARSERAADLQPVRAAADAPVHRPEPGRVPAASVLAEPGRLRPVQDRGSPDERLRALRAVRGLPRRRRQYRRDRGLPERRERRQRDPERSRRSARLRLHQIRGRRAIARRDGAYAGDPGEHPLHPVAAGQCLSDDQRIRTSQDCRGPGDGAADFPPGKAPSDADIHRSPAVDHDPDAAGDFFPGLSRP